MKKNFVMKVDMTHDKTRSKALETVVQFAGVSAVEIKGVYRDHMVVTGDGIDIVGIVNGLRKKVAFADIVSVNKYEPPKIDYKEPDEKAYTYFLKSYMKNLEVERDGILTDNFQAEAKSRRDDDLPGEANPDATFIISLENKRAVEEKKLDLSHGFVGHLVRALEKYGVNVGGMEESRMALVIFSSKYAESRWCLSELLKIKALMEERKLLLVIPIFYKVEQSEVTQLKGDFGVRFWNSWRRNRDLRIIEWKEALKSVASLKGIYLNEEHCSESEFITLTVKEVLEKLILQKGEIPSLFLSTCEGTRPDLPTGRGEKHYLNKCQLFGMEQRMEQFERKLDFDCNETRIIGVVGMPGIGKTTLAMLLYEKWNCKFLRCVPLWGIRKKSDEYGPVWLQKTLLEVLLEGKFPATTHESVKDKLLQNKVFVVLDDVSNKEQLEFLLSDLDWIKKGSKIIITTSDQSLLKGFADDIFVVPLLNDKEAFQLFTFHAFDDQICSATQNFQMSLSRKFVDYTRGHPQALILLGIELYGKDEAHWEHRLGIMTDRYNSWTQDPFRFNQLNERQKDVFLDIVYFFKSEDEYFVRSLLDSGDPDTTGSVSELRDLANKFLITISDGQVEMNDLLYRFSRGFDFSLRHRLWNYEDIIIKLKNRELLDAHNVRGIFLDMSKLTKSISLDDSTFIYMHNLRYLKIYDSCCSRQCIAESKVHFPEGLEFRFGEVRYLHWLKFPLKELATDFRPKNLVDLRLPHSNIERVWEGVKDTPRLKWVDLSHSSNLLDLSALSRAENLQKLNLEGCTSLEELPVEIQNMKSLVFMNLRGCTHLSYLPKMKLISLNTLILSDCSNLEEFQLISESLEVLHLDGTAIKRLPLAIKKLQRLVLLNLKNCTVLECLPNCLGELKALEKLILSGCSRLKNLSDLRENMKHLQSLLINRIGAKEMPNISCANISEGQASADMVVQPFGPRQWPRGVNGVCSLRRLCLSGNDFVSLQTDIGKLYNLNWLDVRQCKLLTSIPMLPPRLQYFDAHGCDSLERVANPLALPVLSEQIHATFNFSNCNKLDEDAKDSIISYTRWRSELVLDAFSRYNGGSVLEDFTGSCLPGWDIPAWFSHQASGSVLKQKLPQHWCDNQFTGIALCAVILFPDYHKPRNRVLVKCNCVFNYKDRSHNRFIYTIGSWREPSNTPGKIEPSHIFVGYTSTLDIKKYGGEADEEGCSQAEASFEFQVTDGTDVLKGCKVL
ncbi:PREDICTED: disease resistance-like protein CSA1 [Camelina sativa]|uniref:ADP-ribosyl cyclase/cyclic ADP-ribose hydrolase n=1 Tax=Camelina sativa TaxID=90675 RepID=A0ABM0UIT6_CAMSA|nr:PREDICTED: disease resistance-like protein CSA1 [Camelina sativa]